MESPEPVNIRFSEAAERAFSFLKHSGFNLTQSDPDRLRYESARAFVTIEWDSRSGELNVFVGPQPTQGGEGDAFSLSDLLAMEIADLPERQTPFQVAEEGNIGPFLDDMAAKLQLYGQPALAGDRMYFRRLSASRSAQAQRYMRDMKLRQTRSEAERAWREQELAKLVDLYSSIENELSDAERTKLDYAKKHQAR